MPIAWLLPLVLTVLVLAAVIPVALLGYLGARDNTDRLMRDRSELILDVVVDRVTAHLDPVQEQLACVVAAVKTGVMDPQDEAAMGAYVAGALAGTPQVSGIAYIRADLTVRRFNRIGTRATKDGRHAGRGSAEPGRVPLRPQPCIGSGHSGRRFCGSRFSAYAPL